MVFQQDNSPIQITNKTVKWLKQKKIKTLDWPAILLTLTHRKHLEIVKGQYSETKIFQNL